MNIQGKNGAYAYSHGGIEKNFDGGLTFSATICATTDVLFKMKSKASHPLQGGGRE